MNIKFEIEEVGFLRSVVESSLWSDERYIKAYRRPEADIHPDDIKLLKEVAERKRNILEKLKYDPTRI